ncbi:rhomboid family intramembrane serine protease [Methyloceanibacter sp.]|uniref:rhomboid family intramembrane serine protease n=1 Tax=Methyloceanibacter sp. TaxID=1965321 RepID=UPI002D5CBF7C|nr:rhomboid family intramembrane serine protease [Methyloceanibacter sp.]HZP10666.1 rhomboid family intramembrane serine protease [Methyloceanibacter sp.]
MPSATRNLILINVAIFALQAVIGDALIANFALWPLGHYRLEDFRGTVGFEPWQLVTYAFLHGSFMHIALNMLALLIFGPDVERTLGTRHFLVLYFAAVISAALVQLTVVTLGGESGVYPTIGASGGIFGVLLAFGMLFPHRIVVLLFPPIPLPAWLLVTLYGLLELTNGVFGTEAGVAHFAHLGGMLGAYLELKLWGRHRRLERW